MSQRGFYLAAYDVSRPSRLRAALALVRAYATGGQKSVHEIFLTPAERSRLMHDMAFILNEEEDRFLLIRLDPSSTVFTLGKAIPPADSELFYIG